MLDPGLAMESTTANCLALRRSHLGLLVERLGEVELDRSVVELSDRFEVLKNLHCSQKAPVRTFLGDLVQFWLSQLHHVSEVEALIEVHDIYTT